MNVCRLSDACDVKAFFHLFQTLLKNQNEEWTKRSLFLLRRWFVEFLRHYDCSCTQTNGSCTDTEESQIIGNFYTIRTHQVF